MLTVVDNHHDRMIGERRTNACHHVGVWFDLHTECRCQRRRDQLDVTDRGEIDEERAVGEAPDCLRSEFDGEAGLADPADPGERDQPIAETQVSSVASSSCRPTIGLTSAGRFDAPKPWRCRDRRQQPRVVGEDRLLQFLQRRSRLESEFGAEQRSGRGRRRQGRRRGGPLGTGRASADPRRALGRGCSPRTLPTRRCVVARGHMPVRPRPSPRPRPLAARGVAAPPLRAGRSRARPRRVRRGTPRGRVAQQADSATRIATTDCLRASVTSSVTRRASTWTWSGSSR